MSSRSHRSHKQGGLHHTSAPVLGWTHSLQFIQNKSSLSSPPDANKLEDPIGWSKHYIKIALHDDKIRHHFLTSTLGLSHQHMNHIHVPLQNCLHEYETFVPTSRLPLSKLRQHQAKFSIEQQREFILNAMRETIHEKKQFVVFSMSAPRAIETHFVSFCIDIRGKTVLVFDPAVGDGITIDQRFYHFNTKPLRQLFEQNGFAMSYSMHYPVFQLHESDVFCQSWSLYMLAFYLRSLDPVQKHHHTSVFPEHLPSRFLKTRNDKDLDRSLDDDQAIRAIQLDSEDRFVILYLFWKMVIQSDNRVRLIASNEALLDFGFLFDPVEIFESFSDNPVHYIRD